MQRWKWLADWLRREDAFFVASEKIVVLSMTVCMLVIGVTAVRTAGRSFVLDEFDAIAACSNLFTFNTASPFYRVRTTTDFNTLFPNLATSAERPAPAPEQKEQN